MRTRICVAAGRRAHRWRQRRVGELAEGRVDGVGQRVDVGHDVAIGVESPAQRVGVAEHGNAEALIGKERHERIDMLQRRAEQIERHAADPARW